MIRPVLRNGLKTNLVKPLSYVLPVLTFILVFYAVSWGGTYRLFKSCGESKAGDVVELNTVLQSSLDQTVSLSSNIKGRNPFLIRSSFLQ